MCHKQTHSVITSRPTSAVGIYKKKSWNCFARIDANGGLKSWKQILTLRRNIRSCGKVFIILHHRDGFMEFVKYIKTFRDAIDFKDSGEVLNGFPIFAVISWSTAPTFTAPKLKRSYWKAQVQCGPNWSVWISFFISSFSGALWEGFIKDQQLMTKVVSINYTFFSNNLSTENKKNVFVDI